MRVLPVIDLQGGVVVRGVAGRRHEYRPIQSGLTSSSQPLDVARAFRDHFGLDELYLADLDAIAGRPPAVDLYAALRREGFRIWVDAGLRDEASLRSISSTAVDVWVVGLETVQGTAALEALGAKLGWDRIAFSLDLKAGQPLGDLSSWKTADAYEIASQAWLVGVRKMIVLDLARVGVGQGTGTEDLCGRLVIAYPTLEVVAGGGVRSRGDLIRMNELGISAAIVASALHDGRLARGDVYLDSKRQSADPTDSGRR